MTVRGRSWAGAVLLAMGTLGAIIAGINASVIGIYAGVAVAVAGVGFVIAAIFAAVREIGANRDRFDAMLRSEVPEKKEQNRS